MSTLPPRPSSSHRESNESSWDELDDSQGVVDQQDPETDDQISQRSRRRRVYIKKTTIDRHSSSGHERSYEAT